MRHISCTEDIYIEIPMAGRVVRIPVRVHHERRSNLRAGVGKHHLLFRLPLGLTVAGQTEAWQWFRTWATKIITEQPLVAHRFTPRAYESGDTITVGHRTYTLHFLYEKRSAHTARLIHKDCIQFRLVETDTAEGLSRAVKTLLSRVIGADFYPQILSRTLDLNKQHFRCAISGVYLKYLSSKWGSCSGKGNINLSTRLLFAPDEVIDYVILHELAHLREMNHSQRFWDLVREAMPDYPVQEKWLQAHHHLCDF
ncbi:MAG: M48 family metallopeptidase [Haliscomenobacter sp.]